MIFYIVEFQLADRRYKPRYIGTWGPDPENPMANNNRFGPTNMDEAQVFSSREEAVKACYLLADDVIVTILPVQLRG